MNFCILGAGAWGTAMAVYLSKTGHVVTLVPRRVEHALAMSSARENTEYLQGVKFCPDLQVGFAMKPALMECDYLFLPAHPTPLEKPVGKFSKVQGEVRSD